jgi:copper(I)-binding protein
MSFKSMALGAAAFLLSSPALAADITVDDAYARAANTRAGAAFMVIRNAGAQSDRLLDVRSDAAQKVQLHTHVSDANGTMRMMHVHEGFEIPAGGEIALARGGDHVMFMGLVKPFEQGATVHVTLVFEVAGEVELDVPVDLTR